MENKNFCCINIFISHKWLKKCLCFRVDALKTKNVGWTLPSNTVYTVSPPYSGSVHELIHWNAAIWECHPSSALCVSSSLCANNIFYVCLSCD